MISLFQVDTNILKTFYSNIGYLEIVRLMPITDILPTIILSLTFSYRYLIFNYYALITGSSTSTATDSSFFWFSLVTLNLNKKHVICIFEMHALKWLISIIGLS